MTVRWSPAVDIEYVGQHSYDTLDGVDMNAIDFGTAFLAEHDRSVVAGEHDAGCNLLRSRESGGPRVPLGRRLLRGCFSSVPDLAIARNIRLGGSRNVQFRVDMFNAPNSAIISGRNTTMNLSSPNDVANAYQNPRTIQLQLRFSF